MSALGLLELALTTYSWLIVFRALASWVTSEPSNVFLRLLHTATEPLLFPLRRLVPPRLLGGLDISPILAILLLQYLSSLVGRL